MHWYGMICMVIRCGMMLLYHLICYIFYWLHIVKIYTRNNILDLDGCVIFLLGLRFISSKLRVVWHPSSGQCLRQRRLHRFQPASQIWKQPGCLISEFFWGNLFECQTGFMAEIKQHSHIDQNYRAPIPTRTQSDIQEFWCKEVR